MSSRGATSVVLGLLVLLLTAFGASGPPAAPSPTPGAPLRVVVAFYPFEFVAERVGGRYTSVETLTAPGQEPHDLELSPRQVAGLAEADLVVYERTFQAAVDEAVTQSGAQDPLDTTTVVPLVDGDPHVWLDPTRLATIGDAVAGRLAALAPERAEDFRANAAALREDLTGLDADYRTGLASCERRAFMTTHEAFGYLAGRYDLRQIGISGLSPEAEPSAARLAEVQGIARAEGLTTIFYETLVSPAVARAVAADLRLRTDVLDPVEGITEESRGQDYLQVMRANLDALRTAGGCR